jgi:hypothetical protein
MRRTPPRKASGLVPRLNRRQKLQDSIDESDFQPCEFGSTALSAIPHRVASAVPRRQWGIRLIIAYKFLKAPAMLGLAIWLTAAPAAAYLSLGTLVHDLAEAGPIGAHAAHWLSANLSKSIVTEAAILAWLDALTTLIEGFLLLRGGVWGEWMVALGLACLLPFELLSLVHRPNAAKAALLAVNAVIVVYLICRRLVARPRSSHRIEG